MVKSNVARAFCVGCHWPDSECKEYDELHPVESDGTYENGRFVCNLCYLQLRKIGHHAGEPKKVQKWARRIYHKTGRSMVGTGGRFSKWSAKGN